MGNPVSRLLRWWNRRRDVRWQREYERRRRGEETTEDVLGRERRSPTGD